MMLLDREPMKRNFLWLRRIVLALCVSWLGACGALATIIHHTGTVDQSAPSDVIVVLGAALSRDGTPYKALSRRSEHAAQLWKQGRAGMVMCTGGIGSHVRVPRSEADGCREILVRAGVPATAIVLEDTSRNTEAQARRIHDIMVRHGWTRATLVSDSYHVFRARYIARAVGIDVLLSPVPASYIDSPAFYVTSLMREVAAMHRQVVR
jgi:uncharacterized SAM-binding protein YcdF (DUF218 family)